MDNSVRDSWKDTVKLSTLGIMRDLDVLLSFLLIPCNPAYWIRGNPNETMEQRNKYVNDLSLGIWELDQMNKADTETIFLTKVKKTNPCLCVCVWRREYWWKERQLWFTCGGSGVEGGHSCSTDAIATIYHCSIWALYLFSFFVAVFAKLAGSTDYFLALYKTCHVPCSVRFVMRETTEPPMCRKVYHMSMGSFFL